MQRLPIFATVQDAYRFLWDNRQDFFSLSYLMIVANSLMQVLIQTQLPAGWTTGTVPPEELLNSGGFPLILVAGFLSVVLYIMFAIAWHRRYLVGTETTTVWGALRWRRRHWSYVARLIGLAFLTILFVFLMTLVAGLVAAFAVSDDGAGTTNPALYAVVIAAGLFVFMFVMRMSLAFPASAVDDRKIGLRGSWRLTKGNGWTLLLIMLLAGLPIGVGSEIVNYVLVKLIGLEVIFGSLVLTLVVSLIQQVFSFIGIGVSTSILSIVYRDLRAMHPPSANTN